MEIIASNDELRNAINDNHLTCFLETMDEDMATLKNEEFTEAFIKKIRFYFKQEIASVYMDSLKNQCKEIKGDLKYALEDEEYFMNRKYIGQEESIGGPVSEEERLKEIHSAQEKQKLFKEQLETFSKIEAELQAVKDKTMVSV